MLKGYLFNERGKSGIKKFPDLLPDYNMKSPGEKPIELIRF